MEVEDELSNFVADLLSYEENEVFLKRLFELQTGEWAKVVELCEGLGLLENANYKVKESAQDLKVVWLDYPYKEVKGYSTILFVIETAELGWNTITFYNKDRLFRNK